MDRMCAIERPDARLRSDDVDRCAQVKEILPSEDDSGWPRPSSAHVRGGARPKRSIRRRPDAIGSRLPARSLSPHD